jgi:ubiquinone/menaquinone biosynthesis C-methylase UbiE
MSEMHGFARWWINRRTESRARRSLRALGEHLVLAPTSQVLELGCGGGGMIALLQERFRPTRLVGTDFDPTQLEAARTYLVRRFGTLPTSIELRTADALQIPFPDATFDAVFAMEMLHHVEAGHHDYVRRPQALGEIRRVLVAGGQLVYSEFSRRAETRATLAELGFTTEFLRPSWRVDLSICRAPRPAAATGPQGVRTGPPIGPPDRP